MKSKFAMRVIVFSLMIFAVAACSSNQEAKQQPVAGLHGSWKLVSATMYQGKDTTVTFPVAGQEMIKLFNGQHFSFFKHDVTKGKDSTAVFDAGAGTFTLEGDVYKENLDYCTARDWEGHKFEFKLTERNDSLIQQGIEKIDSLNINREIIEIYTRIKQ